MKIKQTHSRENTPSKVKAVKSEICVVKSDVKSEKNSLLLIEFNCFYNSQHFPDFTQKNSDFTCFFLSKLLIKSEISDFTLFHVKSSKI